MKIQKMNAQQAKVRLLFVCLGNICRSPAAEGIMTKLISESSWAGQIECDSAGTSSAHEGEEADGRMKIYARERGYELTSRSRPIKFPQDFDQFDYILTMDERNYRDVMRLAEAQSYQAKIIPIVQFCKEHRVPHVPDPYYQEENGFRLVLDILEDACQHLLVEVGRVLT